MCPAHLHFSPFLPRHPLFRTIYAHHPQIHSCSHIFFPTSPIIFCSWLLCIPPTSKILSGHIHLQISIPFPLSQISQWILLDSCNSGRESRQRPVIHYIYYIYLKNVLPLATFSPTTFVHPITPKAPSPQYY